MDRRLFQVVVVLLVCTAIPAGVATATFDETGATNSLDETVASQEECEYPQTVTDATGQEISIDAAPEEVVVTAPNIAQHTWDIGAKEKVTGMPVKFFTSYLEGSEQRTNVVGERGRVVQETVVDLDPDIVLAANVTSKENIQGLRDAGLTVYHYRTATDLESIQSQIEQTGRLVGECEGASEVTANMSETVDQIESAVTDEEQPTVYYDLGFPFTTGSNTVESDVIETAGGDNLAADVKSGYFQISEEVVAAEDPEWIVIAEGSELPDVAGIQESTAVENDQIIEVNSNYFNQHGPRTIVPLQTIAEALHPDALAQAQQTPAQNTPTETETPADETTETDSPTPDETTETDDTASATSTPESTESTETPADDGDGAGFAVVAALLAIGAFVVIARRS